MARSISIIQQQIIDSIRGSAPNYNPPLYDPNNPDPTQRGLTSTSQVSYWLAWTFIVAVAINLFEQVLDIFTATVEQQVLQAPPSTPQWLVQRILEFQYTSGGSPQVVQVRPDFSVGYPTVNPAMRVISQVAITTIESGVYQAKVAFNGVPLDPLPAAALAAYLQVINPAGMTTLVVTSPPDLLLVGGNIFYNAQYASNIQGSVNEAIKNYCANLPDPGTPGSSSTPGFNGIVQLSSLEDAILAVPGVTDVNLTQVELTSGAAVYPLVETSLGVTTTLLFSISTFSGNCIPDTGSMRTLNDTLTFVAA